MDIRRAGTLAAAHVQPGLRITVSDRLSDCSIANLGMFPLLPRLPSTCKVASIEHLAKYFIGLCLFFLTFLGGRRSHFPFYRKAAG